MQQESFLWQIPPFLDCFGDEAAGDCAKLTHKMWSPSALMKYLWLNRLVIFDFLFTVVSGFALLLSLSKCGDTFQRLRVWFSSQVWQAVYPRLVFAPKSDARLQKGMAWSHDPRTDLRHANECLFMPFLTWQKLEVHKEMSESYGGAGQHVFSPWRAYSMDSMWPWDMDSAVGNDVPGDSPQEERRQQLPASEHKQSRSRDRDKTSCICSCQHLIIHGLSVILDGQGGNSTSKVHNASIQTRSGTKHDSILQVVSLWHYPDTPISYATLRRRMAIIHDLLTGRQASPRAACLQSEMVVETPEKTRNLHGRNSPFSPDANVNLKVFTPFEGLRANGRQELGNFREVELLKPPWPDVYSLCDLVGHFENYRFQPQEVALE